MVHLPRNALDSHTLWRVIYFGNAMIRGQPLQSGPCAKALRGMREKPASQMVKKDAARARARAAAFVIG
jgi:hypothetical protein